MEKCQKDKKRIRREIKQTFKHRNNNDCRNKKKNGIDGEIYGGSPLFDGEYSVV